MGLALKLYYYLLEYYKIGQKWIKETLLNMPLPNSLESFNEHQPRLTIYVVSEREEERKAKGPHCHVPPHK